VRIEHISLMLNLVSSSSCEHQKRTKKLKEREKEEEELENHCKFSREELRRKKKMEKKRLIKKKTKATGLQRFLFLFLFFLFSLFQNSFKLRLMSIFFLKFGAFFLQ
jgi:hypothetical protein